MSINQDFGTMATAMTSIFSNSLIKGAFKFACSELLGTRLDVHKASHYMGRLRGRQKPQIHIHRACTHGLEHDRYYESPKQEED